ncbi:hypothetical protein FQ154_12150 [Paeniglutamicibacter gangotriensis]|uniref:DUF4262 domain-containing protein n=1 Tax=Paeniglutamicibacter gangotriensis TaxID=254787 RepID=A0A5B0ECW0_9MICC|nr:hypothetical protein [Paeniglutamicibacter gangotriensis]KAA0976055.1 hypothetical protein FQ154_12150 [Paeniglutamicibacter gangotriensis]
MNYLPCTDPEIAQILHPYREQINTNGFCLIHDSGQGGLQELCYTAGMTEHGLPELIARMEDFAGLPDGTPMLMAQLVVKLRELTEGYADGETHEVKGTWVRLSDQNLHIPLCGIALAMYGSSYRLLQVRPCANGPGTWKRGQAICLN